MADIDEQRRAQAESRAAARGTGGADANDKLRGWTAQQGPLPANAPASGEDAEGEGYIEEIELSDGTTGSLVANADAVTDDPATAAESHQALREEAADGVPPDPLERDRRDEERVLSEAAEERSADGPARVTDYDARTVEELKDEARKRDLPGFSQLNRDDLVKLLKADDRKANRTSRS